MAFKQGLLSLLHMYIALDIYTIRTNHDHLPEMGNLGKWLSNKGIREELKRG